MAEHRQVSYLQRTLEGMERDLQLSQGRDEIRTAFQRLLTSEGSSHSFVEINKESTARKESVRTHDNTLKFENKKKEGSVSEGEGSFELTHELTREPPLRSEQHEVTSLRHELHRAEHELKSARSELEKQRQDLITITRHYVSLRHNRQGLLAGLVSARLLVALGAERVKQIRVCCCGGGGHLDTTGRRVVSDEPVFRVPTPTPMRSQMSEEMSVLRAGVRELQSQVDQLEEQLHHNQQEREKERASHAQELAELMAEVTTLQHEKARLATFEEKLTNTLSLLHSLDQLKLPRRSLGRLLAEAVACGVEPTTHNPSALRFLIQLESAAAESERRSIDGLIRLALQAV